MKANILLGTILAAALALSGCKNTGNLLPSISGKAGEILVVMGKVSAMRFSSLRLSEPL